MSANIPQKGRVQSVTRGKPSSLETLASRVVDNLLEYVKQEHTVHRTLYGIVVSLEEGPPATLTATINGQNVPYIRYVGSAPTVGDTVIVQVHDKHYICLGRLA